MADIAVNVTPSKTQYAQGEGLDLRVQVKNTGQKDVFVVSERVYAWKGGDMTVHILLGQPAPLGGFPFDYIPPKLVRIHPRNTKSLRIPVGMPTRRSFISADRVYFERDKLFGKVEVSVIVGYLPAVFRPKTDEPLREFVGLQRLSRAAKTTIYIS